MIEKCTDSLNNYAGGYIDGSTNIFNLALIEIAFDNLNQMHNTMIQAMGAPGRLGPGNREGLIVDQIRA